MLKSNYIVLFSTETLCHADIEEENENINKTDIMSYQSFVKILFVKNTFFNYECDSFFKIKYLEDCDIHEINITTPIFRINNIFTCMIVNVPKHDKNIKLIKISDDNMHIVTIFDKINVNTIDTCNDESKFIAITILKKEYDLEKIISIDDFIILCINIVKKNPFSLKLIEHQTEEICLEAVRNDGFAIHFVKKQTEQICLEAVKQWKYALQFVKEQTEQICLEAVKINGRSLMIVKEQTTEICLEAVKNDGDALKLAKEQTYELCLEAVKKNGNVLQFVKEQTYELCLEAVKKMDLHCVMLKNKLMNYV